MPIELHRSRKKSRIGEPPRVLLGPSPLKQKKNSCAPNSKPGISTPQGHKGFTSPTPTMAGETEGDSGATVVTKYDAFARASFLLHIRWSSLRDASRKQVSILTISKKLSAANVKFQEIHRYSRNTWKVIFPTKSAANSTLTNKLLKEMGLSAFIPRYKLSRKVILRSISLDFSMEELKSIIEEENSQLMIASLFKLRRRDKISKN